MPLLLLLLAAIGAVALFVVAAMVVVALVTGSSLVAFGGIAAALTEVAASMKRERLRWRATVRTFAAERGLEVTGSYGTDLRGEIEGMQVYVHVVTEQVGDQSQSFRVADIKTGARGVRLRSETALAGFFRGIFGGDLTVGDRAFDDAVHVAGDAVAARALLDSGVRQATRRLLSDRRAELYSDGTLRLYAESESNTDLGDLLDTALAFARQLPDLEGREDERLEAIATTDHIAGVRASALAVLLTRAEGGERVQWVARSALNDEDAEVRLVAATALGDAGALSVLARDEGNTVALRKRAAAELAEGHPEVARDTLGALLTSGSASLAAVAIRELRDHELLDVSMQPALLALVRGQSDGLVTAAIRALGDCGDVGAVETLHAVGRRYSMLSKVPAVTKYAVRQIQGRAAGERGGLSIASMAAEAGAVSVVDPGKQGALSVAAKKSAH